ncbi:TetR family transcriptional regulator [Herbaspirillum lusitanum]|uniref:TetR family transcriptional regulator n=1 Tax=Herbaspirillum lusitanum TaxID=213312 RepID=A0ABW9AD98_9BURK
MNSRAERTRAALRDAALTAFAQRGIRATTLEDVAARANVTRGAVYWHFADKAALVREVFNDLAWPLDIGTNMDAYWLCENPMQLLRQVLWLRMRNCIEDVRQHSMITLLLRQGGTGDVSYDLAGRFEIMTALSVQRLETVIDICYQRGGSRPGLTPLQVAECIHATGLGVLAEKPGRLPDPYGSSFFLPLDLVLLGASLAGDGLGIETYRL